MNEMKNVGTVAKKRKFTLEPQCFRRADVKPLGVVNKNKYGYYGYDYSEINGNGLTRDKALSLINQL